MMKEQEANKLLEADTILNQMTLEEKVDLLGGLPDYQATKANKRIGLPEIRMADGPTGIHRWSKTSIAYPASICSAATWNKELQVRLGEALGRDCRSLGVHILLGPGVNIYRSARCGRNFEYWGEDPFLVSELAVSYIKGVQSQGVAATVKHYAVNFQEYDRHGISSNLDERSLHEIYLPAFKAAVQEGDSGALMTAYNPVNGVHCSEHRELNQKILREQWGYKGVIMSDWVSTYNTVGMMKGALDLEMPRADFYTFEKVEAALNAGEITEDDINQKVVNIVSMILKFGWHEIEQKDATITVDDPNNREVALETARQGIVLLKNDGILPLNPKQKQRLCIIGPSDMQGIIGGGGSSFNPPTRVVDLAEGFSGLDESQIEVIHNSGPSATRHQDCFEQSTFFTPDGKPGIIGEFFDNDSFDGEPTISLTSDRMNHFFTERGPHPSIKSHFYTIRWRGNIKVEESGIFDFYAQTLDSVFRLFVDDQLMLDTFDSEDNSVQKFTLELEAGKEYRIAMEVKRTRFWVNVRLGYESANKIHGEFEQAINLASKCDTVLICTGFNAKSEEEGCDRPYEINPIQEELIKKVSAVNPNLILAFTGGGSTNFADWLPKVNALLHCWYPGQEAGTAIAEIVTGSVNPSGKLPISIEKQEADCSSYNSYHNQAGEKSVFLNEGIYNGYRYLDKNGIAPLFPFGFGLSYTSFQYDQFQISDNTLQRGKSITVQCCLKNTGDYAGSETVQLYIEDCECSLPRPPKELKGFKKIPLQVGESKVVRFEVTEAMLKFYDPDIHDWRAEPGRFNIHIGASSRDIHQVLAFELLN